MANEHDSNLPLAFDGVGDRRDIQDVTFYGRRPLIQGRELNDLQKIIRGRQRRFGRLVAQDGNRISLAFSVVDIEAETVTLTEGEIYVGGDVFPVAEKVITGVPMEGRVEIGVRLIREWITAEDDPNLMGLVPGALSENEDGAAREIAHIVWALATDGGEGEFFQVYLLQDGTILDQTPPPILDGVNQALAIYDRPNGNYIVSGNRVTNLGLNAGKRTFSIEEGEANIYGFKNMREAALRHSEIEVWDVGAVPGETKTYTGGASQVVTTDQFPIAQIRTVLLTKQKSVTITRGALANGIDGLPDTSVIEIVSVTQGATTFVQGTSFIRTGNGIDWAPTGPEPAIGSTYTAVYKFRDSVTPTAITATSFTVSGGVAGGEIITAYDYKLPRIDILGLLASGAPVYIKGVSAARNPVMPIPPSTVLALCEVRNTWMGDPEIVADHVRTGVKSYDWSEIARRFNQLDNHDRLIQLDRIRNGVDRRDPGAKKNTFVDPMENDYFRDEGYVQNGAVAEGVMQLAITPTFWDTLLRAPVSLDWVEEVISLQELKTGCEKINPYANFTPLPGTLVLTPAVDFWTVPTTQWTSEVTVEFQRGINALLRPNSGSQSTSSTEIIKVDSQTQKLPLLRVRAVEFAISGFYPGEVLDLLTFDDVSVKPAGTQTADLQGKINGTFNIPPNIPAGTKNVQAAGLAGTRAQALFTGQGTLEIDVMRRVTTINTWTAPVWVAPVVTERDQEPYGSDPQAQIFRTASLRQIIGMDFVVCKVGDPTKNIVINQVAVDTGFPTIRVAAEALVSMLGGATGWKSARYILPVTTPNDRDHAFVIKTDDDEHSIAVATLGELDVDKQRGVTQHPYPIGPRLSSVNARTWTAHQNSALTFRVVAAAYPVTTKTVELGSFAVVQQCDFQVRAVIDLPSSACSVVFELERTNGSIYRLLPFQVLQLNEFITETVKLRAILTGTRNLSPILYAPVEFITGKIATTAVYVCRAFDLANADRISAYLKLKLVGDSTATFERDNGSGTFTAVPLVATEVSPEPGWIERNYRVAGLTGQTQMRLRITLTGGPGARPLASDLGLGAV